MGMIETALWSIIVPWQCPASQASSAVTMLSRSSGGAWSCNSESNELLPRQPEVNSTAQTSPMSVFMASWTVLHCLCRTWQGCRAANLCHHDTRYPCCPPARPVADRMPDTGSTSRPASGVGIASKQSGTGQSSPDCAGPRHTRICSSCDSVSQSPECAGALLRGFLFSSSF